MRKEDRVRLPPPLDMELPPGFRVAQRPGGYAVYYRYGRSLGTEQVPAPAFFGEDLVCAVELGVVPDVRAWISEQVAEVAKKLSSPQGWRGIRQGAERPVRGRDDR
mgnify:FL=1